MYVADMSVFLTASGVYAMIILIAIANQIARGIAAKIT